MKNLQAENNTKFILAMEIINSFNADQVEAKKENKAEDND